MKKILIALLIGLFTLTGCEKDDTVAEPHVAKPMSQKYLTMQKLNFYRAL